MLLSLLCLGLRPAEAQGTPRAVLVLVPGLRAEDLTRPEVPTLQRLARESATAWMVCRAARVTDPRLLRPDGRETTASLALTLGSGARAIAGPEAEHLGEAMGALTALKARNARLGHRVPIGALGESARGAGRQTVFLGDSPAGMPERALFAVAMDGAGKADVMRLNLSRRDPAAPYGFRADLSAMRTAFRALPLETALTVIAFGDLARADRYAPLCLPAVAAQHRADALRALESLLKPLLMRVSERGSAPTRLLLLAPGPADSTSLRQNRLAPLLIRQPEGASGSLFSPSTRRAGLVLNTDLLPTLAEFLRLPLPPGLTGRPMRPISSPSSPERLAAQYRALLSTARKQSALGGWPTVQLLLVLAGVLALARRKSTLAAASAVAIAALPLGMLLLPPVAPQSVSGAGALLVGFAALLALIARRISPEKSLRLFLLLCAALVAVLLADLLTGSMLLRQAWMSYSVVEGARFYGIGNEYMGAAIGAACVLLAALPGAAAAGPVKDPSGGPAASRPHGRENHSIQGPRAPGIENPRLGGMPPSVLPDAKNPSASDVSAQADTGPQATQRRNSFRRLVRREFIPSAPTREFIPSRAPSAVPSATRELIPSAWAVRRRRGSGFIPSAVLAGCACCLGVLLMVMAAPRWGAKVGAIPSAGLAFGAALLVLWRGRIRLPEIAAGLTVMAALLAVFVVLDLRRPPDAQTHLARAFSGSGGGSLTGIAARKLALEGYLLLHSPWSAAMCAAAVGLLWLRRRRPELFGASEAQPPYARRAIAAGLFAGAAASLLANDSGVTAAAMILLYGWAWASLSASFPIEQESNPSPSRQAGTIPLHP